MSETNGNGHANGNGNGHAGEQIQFVDNAPPAVRARDNASSDKTLSPGAKFFFGWLVDNSYLRYRGGDGLGRITISVRDIQRLTGHDRKSILNWTKELQPAYVWIEHHKLPNAYPVNVYCIRELVPGPQQLQISGLALAWGRARGGMGKFSQPVFSAPDGQSSSQVPENPPPTAQNFHLSGPKSSTSQVENFHLAGPKTSTSQVEKIPLGGGQNGTSEVEKIPLGGGKNGSCEAEKTGSFKETPTETGRPGVNGGGPRPAPLPKFEPLDRTEFSGKRQKTGEKMIELCKEKIHALDNNRKPPVNAKEIVAAYRQRIKEVRGWMAGEVVEK